VQHAHQKGIIHRDLKPSNILVTVIDGAAVPKIIDFGVAKAMGHQLTERTLYTAFHQFVGTPLYMSPEQADLSGMDVDTRSDIYSLGVLLYELLTGTMPFDQDTFRQAAFDELRRIIREQEPPKPSTRLSSLGTTRATVSANRKADERQLNRAVRGELDWIVMKALEKDRRRRYETANDFAADVMRHLTDQPVEACPPSAWYRFSKYARRNRAALVTAGLVTVALIVGTAVSTWQAVVAARARRETSRALATARAEADKATAINEFLVNDLLVQADPEHNPVADQPTLREAMDRAAEKVGVRFRGRPLLEASLRTTISETYHGLGAWTESRNQAAVALGIYERELGPEPAETLKAARRLGHALYHENKYAEAEPLLRKSLEGLRRVLGEGHYDTLDAMEELATLYRYRGKVAEAETLLIKTLDGRRRTLGWEHNVTLTAMNNLALVYMHQGKPAQAEPLLAKVLEVRRRVLRSEHPDTSTTMSNLAMAYRAQGQFSKAEPLLVEALEISQRVRGEEHSRTLTFMNNLALLYRDQGQYPKAERLLVKVVEVSRRVLGEDHSDTLGWTKNLAHLYWLNRKLDSSVPLYENLVKRTRALVGPDHPDTLHAMANLGVNYRDAGRVPEARALLEQAWAKPRKPHGPPANDLEWIRTALAETYDQAGQFANSELLYHEVLKAARSRHGEASVEASGALASLGLSLLKQRKYADAEPLLRKCLAIREQKQPDGWTTFNTRSLLGGSLLGQRKYADAEPLLLAGYEGMKQREGKMAPIHKVRLTDAVERLVQLYETWRKPEKTAVWRARLDPTDLPAEIFARP
jgi:tetratricopeptide (TPR) repeat protein